MKRLANLIFSVTCILFFSMHGLYGQAPQLMNYQAIVRDADGIPKDNEQVSLEFEILQGSPTGDVVYEESHTITSNEFGLVSVIIGNGTSTFMLSDIDWSQGPFYLKTFIDGDELSNTELLSVPFSLYANTARNGVTEEEKADWNESYEWGNHADAGYSLLTNDFTRDNDTIYYIDGNVGIGTMDPRSTLSVFGSTANDSAIFEVKNNDGHTVFAVYNEGVRIFVEDNQGGTKGPKGGFAIGGFNDSKQSNYEFFRVTPDSVRIYLDEGATKGTKGGFAIGGFERAKGLTGDIMHMSEDNYFIGYESGSNITTGLYNSFFGYQAGVMNNTGSNNLFMGYQTGYINTLGSYNVFLGTKSGYSNVSGLSNVFIGQESGYTNDGGSYNVFLGTLAGNENISGQQNVYLGQQAGEYSSEGSYNVAIGTLSGRSNAEGLSNVFIGNSSGMNTTDGSYNVFIGTLAGSENITGKGNVYVGQQAGRYNTEGSYNVVVGDLAGENNLLGEKNVFLGYTAGYNETSSNRLYIDNNTDQGNYAFIYGKFDEDHLSFNATLDVWEELWVYMSIYELGYAGPRSKGGVEMSGVLNQLKQIRPLTYSVSKPLDRSKSTEFEEQIGLSISEVEKQFPALVGTSKNGDKGIKYSRLSVVLVQAIKEQQTIIDSQEARLMELEEKVEMLINK